MCRNAKFRHALLSCVRVSKMQGAEIEDEGSVLKYMTKSEIEEQRSSLLIMTQRLNCWNCKDVYTHPNRNVLSQSAPFIFVV